jgi:hypothetical protein
MSSFFLHGGEKEALELAEKLNFDHGRALPPDATFRVVIQWGVCHKELPGVMVLQPVKAVLRVKARDQRNRLLHMHGIKTLASHGGGQRSGKQQGAEYEGNQHGGKQQGATSFPYRYKVAVFHLETLTVYERKETVWISDSGMRGVPRNVVRTGTGIGAGTGTESDGDDGRDRDRDRDGDRDSGRDRDRDRDGDRNNLSGIGIGKATGVSMGNPKSETAISSPSYEEVDPGLATYHVRRASREAVRALYALGLDYGLVTIGVTPQGHTIVLDVEPAPKLDGRLLDLFAQAMNKYEASLAKELQREEPVMLGSDPEFLLLSPQGKVVSASRFLEREGAVGCDAIVLSGHRIILPLAELRPQPSTSPRELASNLHRTMQLAARKINDESLSWLSGGMPLKGFPLGGHVHFSRCWLNSHLLRAFDTYLALPLMLIEGESTRQRRPRYGYLGDFRRQSHGGFEYRTLPSWLISPAIACGILALASLIADNYRKLPTALGLDPNTQSIYYAGDKVKLLPTVTLLWQQMESLGEPYDQYAAYLKPLKNMVLQMKPWDENNDIRRTWKITPFNVKEAIHQQIML